MQISFIPNSFFVTVWQSVRKAVQQAIQNYADSIDGRDEIKVWQKVDRQGNAYWRVYDPKTGQTADLGSEIEVMAWVERHYYF